MPSFLLLSLTIFHVCFAYCPFKRAVVKDILMIPTDDYLSVEQDEASEKCEIEVHSADGHLLLVSITNFLMFSHRRPQNKNEIIVRNADMQFIVDSKPKGYQLMQTPIWLEIPMNLNFRSILLFSNPRDCNSYDSLKCPEYSLCYNCSKHCFSIDLECDGLDTCGEDESRCIVKDSRTPQTSYRYGRDALSSSQIMLIWFFALNGSFIVFFLILSLCSAGLFYQCPFYAKNSKASRHTFIRYLREAIPPALAAPAVPTGGHDASEEEKTVISTPPGHTRHRHSILSRINFQPAPALSEIEPEVEDREQSAAAESICEPPAHQPEVFLRRQSLPFGLKPPSEQANSGEKRTRFTTRAMSFQH
ncbi:unnamed protein product [Caenorhabditis sp. 36 PRJEB53466]|nr:unnamed protein product [Caenorhabditis sp. 36 PRJEB53466]